MDDDDLIGKIYEVKPHDTYTISTDSTGGKVSEDGGTWITAEDTKDWGLTDDPETIIRTPSTTEYEIQWDKVTCFDHLKDILKAINVNIHYTDGNYVNSGIQHLIKEKE
jgi:hypothetical protein